MAVHQLALDYAVFGFGLGGAVRPEFARKLHLRLQKVYLNTLTMTSMPASFNRDRRTTGYVMTVRLLGKFNLHMRSLPSDGSYRESGREIFDEEADTPKEDKKSMMKSSVKHKNVSRPTGNIKSLLMMSSGSQKKKSREVLL